MQSLMANWAWPEITDEDSALEASHIAGGWAAVVGGFTALLAIIALLRVSPIAGFGASACLDAALFGIVAWRVWNGSRPWAITGLVLYLFEIGSNVARGHFGIGVIAIIITLGLVAGVRGTFALHRFREERARLGIDKPIKAIKQSSLGLM